MEVENQAVETGSPEAAPQSVEASPSTSNQGDITPNQGGEQQAAPAEPAWTPNYKVKAYDSEYEIPEDFRGYINKDNEKKFKEVFERSYAFDTIKQKYKDAHSKYSEVHGKYEGLNKSIDKMSKYVQKGDYEAFFQTVGIPEEAIQKWMYQKLSVKDLPQEQQQLYTKNSEYQRELMQRDERMETLEAQVKEFDNFKRDQAIQQRFSELDSTISSPKYKQFAETFDARAGKPGAFREEVILRAAAVANATGRDMSPEEAVQELAKFAAWDLQNGGQAPDVQAPNLGSRPTIPSVTGKTSSPVAKSVKSLDDLKKLRSAALRG